jgi:putative hydrolases of HD superfamily
VSALPGAEIDRLFEFVIELDRLKGVSRRIKPVGFDRYENSAEHSWHVCLLAIALAPHAAAPVDLQRVLEILLVHDVPEIDAGDRFVYGRDAAAAAIDEGQAALRIFGMLPAQGDRLLARWREYEERRSAEARLAYAADRLLPMLQNLFGGGQSWRENSVPFEHVHALAKEALAETCPAVWKAFEPRLAAAFPSHPSAARL